MCICRQQTSDPYFRGGRKRDGEKNMQNCYTNKHIS